MVACQLELPRHVYVVALEEHLLLFAFKNLFQGSAGLHYPPTVTMACRNDIIQMSYVSELATCFTDNVLVRLPEPIGEFSTLDPDAEQLAWHYRNEGMGSTWTMARTVVAALDFVMDGRPFANGLIFNLGLYAKGGIAGLARNTGSHVNVC